jgi:two-component system sensor histidine kinase CreC
MHLGIRLLFAFFLLNGIAAFFVLQVLSKDIKSSSREVMEDLMVDTANVLAELAHTPNFDRHLDSYAKRSVKANIWGTNKDSLDYRVYVTDKNGIVVYDSESSFVGKDFSKWRDVARTLRGEYGARSTREVADDEASAVMHVAAPIYDLNDRNIITGVITVAKPASKIQKFIDRTKQKILINGLWWLLLSLAVGVLVTVWLVWSIRRLRDYALNVQLVSHKGNFDLNRYKVLQAPDVPGELGDLARAMGSMRRQLDGSEYVQDYVRALTHELKTPIAAIQANAELMQDSPIDREGSVECLAEIHAQTERMTQMVNKMLELSKLEQGVGKQHFVKCTLRETLAPLLVRQAQVAERKNIVLEVQPSATSNESLVIAHDPELIRLAVSNVLDNAMSFQPDGGKITVFLLDKEIQINDNGLGVDESAFSRLGERFFSTARPNGIRNGSGLGLAICRQIMLLHGGNISFVRLTPSGLGVRLVF